MSNKYALLSLIVITFGIIAQPNDIQAIKQLIARAQVRRQVIFEQYTTQDKQASKDVPFAFYNRPAIGTMFLDELAQERIALHLLKEQIAQQLTHATKPQLLQALIANEEHILCLNKQLLEDHTTYDYALFKMLGKYILVIPVSYVMYEMGTYTYKVKALLNNCVMQKIKSNAAWLALACLCPNILLYGIKAKSILSLRLSIRDSKCIIAFAQNKLDYFECNNGSAAESAIAQGDQHA